MAGMASKGQNRISMAGDQFIDEQGSPFYPMVMNYYVNYAWYPSAPDPYPDQVELQNVHMAQTSLYGAQGNYSYTNLLDGPTRIQQDLYEMKLLGFNTIRLVMTPLKKQGTGFRIEVSQFAAPASGQPNAEINLDPPYDPATNPVAAFHFNTVLAVCSLANTLDMKVLLITADSPSDFPELIRGNAGSTEIADYSAYLLALAQFLHDPAHEATNLLGYDVYGEPGLAELGKLKGSAEGMHSKSEVCDIVDEWSAAIRAGDPQALITAGGYLMNDGMAGGWDPELSKIDFATFHIYPDQTIWEFEANPLTFRQKMIDRYNNQLSVMDRTLHKPYMIAETSYSAHDGPAPYVYPVSVLGNEADQDNFVQQTYPAVRATRACGYAWWDFQNKHWYPDPPISPDFGFGAYLEDYMGLLNYGNPGPMDMANGISGYEAYRKDAALTFANYAVNPPTASPTAFGPVSPTVDMSDPYYNPYDHPENNSTTNFSGTLYYGTLTGHVQDQSTSMPIAGVVVKGTCIVDGIYNVDGTFNEMYHSTYSFTDDNGEFILRGFDTAPGEDHKGTPTNSTRDRCIMDLKIGTYGAGWTQYGDWDGSTPILQNQTYPLHSAFSSIDRVLDGVNVGLTEEQNYEATASLTAKHFTVEGDGSTQGGTSVLKATYEDHLLPGFHAQKGSEVHVYTESVLMDCGAVEAGNLRRMFPVDDGASTPVGKPQRSIGLVLHPDPEVEEFQISPNPSNGIFNVTWECAYYTLENPAQLTLTTTSGSVLLERTITPGRTELNLRPAASGTYNVSIEFRNKIRTRRIVIQ